jgi:hypothetical protein
MASKCEDGRGSRQCKLIVRRWHGKAARHTANAGRLLAIGNVRNVRNVRNCRLDNNDKR